MKYIGNIQKCFEHKFIFELDTGYFVCGHFFYNFRCHDGYLIIRILTKTH